MEGIIKKITVFSRFVLCIATFWGCGAKNTPTVSTSPESSVVAQCPNDKAIVSLTYDDGLSSQLRNAISVLNEYQLRGTFFLNDVSAAPQPWRDVKAAGHELAAHTFNHPCTKSFDWVNPLNASEAYSERRLANELDRQIELLQSLGQQAPFSFAYPCGTTWIGKMHKSYVPLIEERFIAARGVEGEIRKQKGRLMNVGAYFIEGPKEALIETAMRAMSEKGWLVFGFHGIGGDYLSVSDQDHRALLQFLAMNKGSITVLPFGEAAQCMSAPR